MQITIDLLSLFIGLIFGMGFVALIVMHLYFDDKWDTAFGEGWRCGNEYREKEQKNNE